MRNFKACVSDPSEFVTAAGSPVHVLYSSKVMPDGKIRLIESGKENIQDKINSFRDQTDMSYILSRLMVGDTSVLTDKQPMYGDFTNVPKTYAEALQIVMDAEKQFMTLPLDVRKKFDNDYRLWLATSGSDTWLENMGIPKSEPVPVEPDPVKEKEVTE